MIGNKLEQSIIDVFQSDLSSTFSINMVSKILNKSYPLINKKSNFFLHEGVLNKINIGKSYQCFLNMQNDKTRILMALNEVKRKEEFITKAKEPEFGDECLSLALRYHIDSIIVYKKMLIFVSERKSDHEDIKQHSLLTRRYTFIFMDRQRLKELYLEDRDFQRYHIVLHNPYYFVELLSELKDRLILKAFNREKEELKEEPEE